MISRVTLSGAAPGGKIRHHSLRSPGPWLLAGDATYAEQKASDEGSGGAKRQEAGMVDELPCGGDARNPSASKGIEETSG